MEIVSAMKCAKIRVSDCIFCAIVNGFSKQRGLRAAVKVYEDLVILQGCEPGQVTYASISVSTIASGFIYKPERINGGVIDRAMAGIMVSIFSKMSRIDKLVKLLQDMKTEGTPLDGRLYRSALNSLREAGLQVQAKWLTAVSRALE
ncbi:hypothetical protein Vadar_019011 [Vaccinium darrowii]|uniref:Uncharacterized protein n=1 Tax=Vaccinium darrowii TaxID=229202 RepID=A0ACB7XRK2_9ERIC|nr:hypothetical protein Vadar_019011 [Vaccinium darrowii]